MLLLYVLLLLLLLLPLVPPQALLPLRLCPSTMALSGGVRRALPLLIPGVPGLR